MPSHSLLIETGLNVEQQYKPLFINNLLFDGHLIEAIK